MTEAQEQARLVRWAIAEGLPLFHIPNGGRRDPKQAASLKAQGVRKGVPDLCLPVARGPYHSLFIEMKHGKNKLTAEQSEWIELLAANGMACAVCYSCEEAQGIVRGYLGLEAVE